MPKDKAVKIEKNGKIIDIVERILELNSENQLGLGLKILIPNQMLSRLPITLAQLKAQNNSEKLNLDKYCIFCADQKKLTKQLQKQ